MNEPDANRDPDLDPGTEEQVRALLAEESAGPMPADVAARLDETLAGLVAEREAEQLSQERTATGAVVPLRPRWMPRIAAGAAAVIVLGLGGITLASNWGGASGSGSDSTASDAGAGKSLQGETASEPPAQSGAGQDNSLTERQAARDDLPRLQAASFPRDVQVLLSQRPALRGPAAAQERGDLAESPTPASPEQAPSADAACPGPTVANGATVTLALLDSTPVALVVRPPEGGKRLVEAWSCDGSRRLASTTVAP